MSKFRIKRYKKTLVLVVASHTTVIAQSSIELNGVLLSTNVKTPAAVDTSATIAVKLTDADGVDVFSRSAIAANTNTQALLTNDTRVPLSGSYTLTVTFSAAQATNRSTDVTLVIDRGA